MGSTADAGRTAGHNLPGARCGTYPARTQNQRSRLDEIRWTSSTTRSTVGQSVCVCSAKDTGSRLRPSLWGMRQTSVGLLVTSGSARYIEILCGPKWYCWRSQRIFSIACGSVLAGCWFGKLDRSFSPFHSFSSNRHRHT